MGYKYATFPAMIGRGDDTAEADNTFVTLCYPGYIIKWHLDQQI